MCHSWAILSLRSAASQGCVGLKQNQGLTTQLGTMEWAQPHSLGRLAEGLCRVPWPSPQPPLAWASARLCWTLLAGGRAVGHVQAAPEEVASWRGGTGTVSRPAHQGQALRPSHRPHSDTWNRRVPHPTVGAVLRGHTASATQFGMFRGILELTTAWDRLTLKLSSALNTASTVSDQDGPGQ